jgi:hypothetical protein
MARTPLTWRRFTIRGQRRYQLGAPTPQFHFARVGRLLLLQRPRDTGHYFREAFPFQTLS